jgi:hypothetical protein
MTYLSLFGSQIPVISTKFLCRPNNFELLEPSRAHKFLQHISKATPEKKDLYRPFLVGLGRIFTILQVPALITLTFGILELAVASLDRTDPSFSDTVGLQLEGSGGIFMPVAASASNELKMISNTSQSNTYDIHRIRYSNLNWCRCRSSRMW